MARDSYTALQLKIEKEIIKLQKQAKALQAKQRTPVINSIVRTMREYNIAPEELAAALNKKPAKSTAEKANNNGAKAKNPVPQKYRHPESGASWTGRGKPPRWITAAEAQGKKRNDFLITPAA